MALISWSLRRQDLAGIALLSAFSFASGSISAGARAATLPHPNAIVSYEVVEQELPALLDGIARQIGVHAEVSAKVEGHVHGRLPAGNARELLDDLAAVYGFEWYFDGRAIHVSATSESIDKIVPIRRIAAADLQETLVNLAVVDPRWPIRYSRRGDVADIAGPPHYVALIEQTIAAMPETKAETVAEVRVFRGSSAQ